MRTRAHPETLPRLLLCAATALALCLVSVQVLAAQSVDEGSLGAMVRQQEGAFRFGLRDSGSPPIGAFTGVGVCIPGDPTCPPPDVTITPAGGSFTTAAQSVTIDWCGHTTPIGLVASSRQIVFNGVDVTASFSYAASTKTGCTSHVTSTGTITLPGGTTTLTASIEDNVGQLGSDGDFFTLVQNHLVSLAPYNGTNLDVSKCLANCGGDVVVTYSTPSYRSLDTDRGLTLVYRDAQSHPTATITMDVKDTSSTRTVDVISTRVLDSTGALAGAVKGGPERFFHNLPGQWMRLGARFFVVTQGTGAHPYTLVVKSYYTNGDTASTVIPLRVLVTNEQSSPFGGGWSVAGLERVYPQTDGGMVRTDGTGTVQYYAGSCAAAPCSYVSPAGEFSVLSKHAWGDGTTYDRRAPDGSVVAFTSDGREAYAYDRFGNRTSYGYEANGMLRLVTDPTGQAITITSAGTSSFGGPKYAITDPAGRVTTLNLNSSGDLASVQDPAGGTPFQGTYWPGHYIQSWQDRRGGTWGTNRDCAAHISAIIAPAVTISDGSTVTPTTLQTHQDVQTTGCSGANGRGDRTAPATASDTASVRAIVTDAGNHATAYAVDSWGEPLSITDAFGRTTTITRDANGLVTQVQHPTGAIDVFRYSGQYLLMSRLAGQDSTNYRWNTSLALPDSIWGPRQSWQGFVYTASGAIQTVNARYAQGASTTFSSQYTTDSRGRVLTMTDPASHVTKFFYNGRFWNLDSTSMAAGQWQKTTYDIAGRDSVHAALGSPASTTTLYDALNRVMSAYDGAHAQPFQYHYGAIYLDSITDPMGQTFRRQVNALGWKTSEPDVDPAKGAITFKYDVEGQVTSWTNRRGQTINLTYDALHRVTSRTGPTMADNFGYSADDRRMAAWNGNSTDSLYFSANGWTDSTVTRIGGQRFRQLYVPDVGQRLDSVDIAMAGGAITFAGRKYLYDAVKNTPTTIRINGVAGASFDYDGEMFLSGIRYLMPGGQEATRQISYTSTHQAYGDFISLSAFGSTYFSRYVGYDSLGRIRERISSNDAYGGRSFKYTPSGQLNEYARYSSLTASPCPFDANFGSNCISRFDPTTPNEKDVYSFDDALNRRFDTNSGRTANGSTWSATTEFTYGTGDRIATSADFSFDRDLDGNVTRRYNTAGTDVHYAWDEQGRLVSATVPGPGPGIGNVVMYEYNAFGQLVRRRTYGLTDRYFLWNGDDLLAELDGSATSRIAEYVYWSTDQPMAIVTGASGIENIDYFLQDQLGNVRTAFRRASNASTTFSSDYSSWGLARDDTLAASSPNRLRWKGMFWEGGWTQLYYARNRWYSPQFGGFMAEDPLGPAGGANTYAFADNDPINGADPYGLHWIGGGIVEQFRLFSPIRPSRPSAPPTAASTGPSINEDLLQRGANWSAATGHPRLVTAFAFTEAVISTVSESVMPENGGIVPGGAATSLLVTRSLGKAGEAASGLAKNFTRIPSATGTAAFRVPDGLTETTLSEVKNVSKLYLTNQLRDFASYARQSDLQFELWVRPSTNLSGPLNQFIRDNAILVRLIQ